MAGKSKEYDIAFKLSGLMDPSLKRSVGNAEEHIQELERAIKELSNNGGFDRLRKDAKQAEGAFDGLKERAEGFKETFDRVLDFTGAKALIDAGIGSLQNIVGTITDQDDAMAQLQASTGMTADQMKEMNAIAEDLYKQNYGEGFDDLGDSMAVVKQTTQQTGDELEKTTKTAIAFRDVFQEDIPESVKAADTLMKKFGITSEQSYNLMAQGAQKGLNKAGDLLDTTNEYAVYFKTLGYNANEMFDIFSAGMENGAFNLDKVADAVKEFGIRIKDGSDSTGDAIFTLFQAPDVSKFAKALTSGGDKTKEFSKLVKLAGKDSAIVMRDQLKKGGAAAQTATKRLKQVLGSGQDMLDGLSKGSISGRQAMEQVINKLRDIKDPVEQSTLAVALFGTQWEDMESNVVLALGNARQQFDMTKQTMEEVAKVKYDTLTQQFQTVGRELMSELVIPIGEDLMPALQDVAHWMGDNKDLLEILALGAPAAMIGKNAFKIGKGIMKIGTAAEGVGDAVKGVETVAEGAGGAAAKFGGAIGLLTNPVGLAVGALGGLTLGVLAYQKHQENARLALLHMGDGLDEAAKKYQEAKDKAKLTNDLIWQYEDLSKKIAAASNSSGNMAVNTGKLKDQQDKLRDVISKLQELHPETIRQYDVENGKIGEKLGLLKRESDAEQKLAKVSLEREVAEGRDQLPDLEKQMTTLNKRSAELEKQQKILDPAVVALKEYEAEYQRIMMQTPSNERAKQLEELRSKANQTASDAGYNQGGRNFNTVEQLANLDQAYDTLNNELIEGYAQQQKALEELGVASGSYDDLYEKQKGLIEMKLGGTLEEQAAKYKKMSDAEKKQFNQAMQDIANLNQAMDLLPDDKKVNLQLIWQQTGQIPNFDLTDSDWNTLSKTMKTGGTPNLKTPSGVKINRFAQHDPGFEGYADGGIATKPSIFGEAGPEIAIPLNNKPRSHALLDAANKMMGRVEEKPMNVSGAPNLAVQPPEFKIPDYISFTERPAILDEPVQPRPHAILDTAGGMFGQNGGGDEISVVFAPKVIIQGGGEDVAAQVSKALKDQQPAFERQFMAMLARRERVSMNR
ncbi:Phage-related minor tail protein [Paenibacillus sophorae]|uniref:Phage tail tape measure protein n=1 Tax=Paenibacillus sophorae TaxID=1333845 RepID=A0A1H8VS46_9BACL|nr:phage tail tape measure protein [Paenibacillus sophorae]QWU15674.1 phage tail tape measure protein [Paenibacillus sophorae]SEP18134.1 Phage-related minor tail protein [Paenibacillus sophorae]